MKSTVQTTARRAALDLRGVLSRNLAVQRQVGRQHAAKVAAEEREHASYERQFKALIKRASNGAKNLVHLHATKEIQEVLTIIAKIHSQNPVFELHEGDIDLGGEFQAWVQSRCRVWMSDQNVILEVTGQQGGEVFEDRCCLNDPGTENEPMTLEGELEHFCSILRMGPKQAVQAVERIDLFAEPQLSRDYFLSWLAFLVACADKKQLEKLMQASFEGLSS